MSAGALTVGRRVADETAPWELEDGEYCLYKDAPWVRLPNGIGPCNLKEWSPVWHEDGTLTLSPSILDRGGDPSNGIEPGWHGYLERGVWREV